MIEISPAILLVELISFLVLMGLLSKFLFGPIRKFLEKRREAIDESFALIKEEKESAAKMMDEARENLVKAQEEAKGLVEKAVREGEAQKVEIIDRAKREAELLLKRAEEEIERKREETISEIRAEIANISILCAKKILQEEIDGERAHRLIDGFVEELKEESVK
jgi:F-type H+-transporting ATPase subunit b